MNKRAFETNVEPVVGGVGLYALRTMGAMVSEIKRQVEGDIAKSWQRICTYKRQRAQELQLLSEFEIGDQSDLARSRLPFPCCSFLMFWQANLPVCADMCKGTCTRCKRRPESCGSGGINREKGT